MHSVTNIPIASEDYAGKNLRKFSFRGMNLVHAKFTGSDLRGTDFTGADLTGADLSNSRTGIPPIRTVIVFLAALAISAISGWVSMLAGQTMHDMLVSTEKVMRISGIITVVVILLFIGYSCWRGIGNAVRQLIIPVIFVVIVLGTIAAISGLGSGKGALYITLSFVLVVAMFIVGTLSRTAAGSLSDIMFTVVALGGGLFAKSLGGGVGTVIMAISCMIISKRALSGAKGFDSLRKIAAFVTRKFGTSFRDAKLVDTNFSQSRLRNADFTGADISSVNWSNAKKFNCIKEGKLEASGKRK